MVLGLDYAGGRPNAAEIRSCGYGFVVRYLSDGGPGLPGKLLTPDEADALRAAGVDIVANWETTADRMLDGHDAGVSDATAALAQVLACGGRRDRPIYFSADFDAAPEQQDAINEYLRGAGEVLGPQWVGIYSGYWPVSRALDAGAVRWAWQTDAWSGGNVEARAQLHQRIEQVDIDGVSCDVNESRADDYGQWSATTPDPTPQEPPVFDSDRIADVREQLCGQGSRDPGQYTGWAQLGQDAGGNDRTVVDALAAVVNDIALLKSYAKAIAAKLGVDIAEVFPAVVVSKAGPEVVQP
ncbi:DUF1906 domain-containing protein [Nocardia tengchongensis]|uniref:DUF1906 domain-containing protein n=1 Tax=Nocardia tengchongensis TaxID=2055889 RepID=UPI00361FBBC5